MWNKNMNKALIFVILSGFSVICYAQSTSNEDAAVTTTSYPSSSSSIVIENEEEKHNKTTTTTTTTTTTIAPTQPTTTTTTIAPTQPTTTTTTVAPTQPTTSTTTTTTTTTTTPPPRPPTTPPTTTTTTTTPKSTTTTSSTTTTTVKPTPTPKPPKPDIGLWNCSCIKLQMAAEIHFSYATKDNKTANASLVVPSNARPYDCACTDNTTTQSFALEWGPENQPDSLSIHFEKKDNKFGLFMLTFKINPIELINAKDNKSYIQLLYSGYTFSTPLQMSYHCTRQQELNLTSTIPSKEIIGVVRLQDLQFEAFHSGNKTFKFSTAKDCDSIDTPDIVPIAVGIALIALILIILITYLVARRRSTARGYMSF